MATISNSVPTKKRSTHDETKKQQKSGAIKGNRPARIRWKRWVLGIPLGFVLPFILLVRVSSWLYSEYALNAWLSVAAGAGLALLFLIFLSLILARRAGLKPGRRSAQSVLLIFGSYTVYLLVFISASNVKAPEIRETYTSLHPVLRVAISTFMILDQRAVVTDSQRNSTDYTKMGLQTPQTSMHFVQDDGFAHAIDLRTNDRTEIRNVLTAGYFRLMGFSTLRHTGTADHLHVSLRTPQE